MLNCDQNRDRTVTKTVTKEFLTGPFRLKGQSPVAGGNRLREVTLTSIPGVSKQKGVREPSPVFSVQRCRDTPKHGPVWSQALGRDARGLGFGLV